MATKSRLAEYDELSVPEKILQLQDLWDELAKTPDAIPITAAQRRELDRRLDEFKADPTKGSPWSEVRARIRKRRS